jgi:hypothetical protein
MMVWGRSVLWLGALTDGGLETSGKKFSHGQLLFGVFYNYYFDGVHSIFISNLMLSYFSNVYYLAAVQ